ncbi:hypothetical protein DY000_02025932 [Brassica cretica]|uniref:Uncharacterized protein n=1 Tax=Brassica cretica TaxID=69181 RepID=A0ABQ7EFS1_BRACR|nr:hypothetical protein DY000_02025932 [Brassica cretica]
MATDWNRGNSVDAKPNLSPFRSLLATDFARKLVVAISEGMTYISRAPSNAPSPAHPRSVTGSSTLRHRLIHRLIHASSPAHLRSVTGSSKLRPGSSTPCHRLRYSRSG